MITNADIFFRYVDGGVDQFIKIDASNNGALIHSTGQFLFNSKILTNFNIDIQSAATLTVGVDGNAGDVIFYSSTAGDYFYWDEDNRLLQLIDSRFDLVGPNAASTAENAPLAFSVVTGSGAGSAVGSGTQASDFTVLK